MLVEGAGWGPGAAGLPSSLCLLPRSSGALPHSTMMGKLPLGVVSPYVKMSSGGCTDPLKFYATSYCVAYGEGSLGAGPSPRTQAGQGRPSCWERSSPSGLSHTQGDPSLLNQLVP